MDIRTMRPDHIEDWLCQLHPASWFYWEDPENKVYANLVIRDTQYAKPTEQECIDGLAQMQADFDAKQYQRERAVAYPSIADQLDQIYHEGIDAWKETIAAVKAEYPKP
jgi:hypothetical protein